MFRSKHLLHCNIDVMWLLCLVLLKAEWEGCSCCSNQRLALAPLCHRKASEIITLTTRCLPPAIAQPQYSANMRAAARVLSEQCKAAAAAEWDPVGPLPTPATAAAPRPGAQAALERALPGPEVRASRLAKRLRSANSAGESNVWNTSSSSHHQQLRVLTEAPGLTKPYQYQNTFNPEHPSNSGSPA